MKKMKKQCITSLLLVLSLALCIIQTVNPVNCDTTPQEWGLNLQIQNGTATTHPFDEVQLTANVTYGGVNQPDVLVTFKLQGPDATGKAVNITRIISTDANGVASWSFRVPIEGQDPFTGNWTGIAVIQTENGTLEEDVSFNADWSMEITSIRLIDIEGESQTSFYTGEIIETQITIENKEAQAKTVNINVDMEDSTGKIVNQTSLQNVQIQQNTTIVPATIQLPNNTPEGLTKINVGICSGTFENISIPVAENKTKTFSTLSMHNEPTSSPSSSSSPTPTATPPEENAISLFSWLLVATGIFTFTALFFFLRRKPTGKLDIAMPSLPVSSTTLTSSPPPDNPFTPTLQPEIASAPVMEAKLPEEPKIDVTLFQEQGSQTVLAQLSKISSSVEKIQAMRIALNLEKQQLVKDLGILNLSIEEQEKVVKKYFETIREKIVNIEGQLTSEDTQTEPKEEQDNN
ncbi:MAG: hypothetical protein NWF01_08235 [Candidatus Bathyarchaeota archaeon]|nr:hypothetical protein [Candidatus Bathyarchaeota archaeon]